MRTNTTLNRLAAVRNCRSPHQKSSKISQWVAKLEDRRFENFLFIEKICQPRRNDARESLRTVLLCEQTADVNAVAPLQSTLRSMPWTEGCNPIYCYRGYGDCEWCTLFSSGKMNRASSTRWFWCGQSEKQRRILGSAKPSGPEADGS